MGEKNKGGGHGEGGKTTTTSESIDKFTRQVTLKAAEDNGVDKDDDEDATIK